MLHGVDGQFHIIEYSPICQMESPEQLHVNGVPGVYIFDEDGNFRFQPGRYWAHELALREFLSNHYLPALQKPKSLAGAPGRIKDNGPAKEGPQEPLWQNEGQPSNY
jgi:hypothetical protein